MEATEQRSPRPWQAVDGRHDFHYEDLLTFIAANFVSVVYVVLVYGYLLDDPIVMHGRHHQ